MAKPDPKPSSAPPPDKPPAAEAFRHPPVRITCSTPGFRRAGVSHPAVADHPADTFTREQIEAFQAEPMLKLSPVPEAE